MYNISNSLRSLQHVGTQLAAQLAAAGADGRGFEAFLHLSEQNLTSSQLRSHALRHTIIFLHWAQYLNCLYSPRSNTLSPELSNCFPFRAAWISASSFMSPTSLCVLCFPDFRPLLPAILVNAVRAVARETAGCVNAHPTCTPAAATRNTLQRRARRPVAVCRNASVVTMGRATAAAVPRRSRLAEVSRPGMMAALCRPQAGKPFPPVQRLLGCLQQGLLPSFAEKCCTERSESALHP